MVDTGGRFAIWLNPKQHLDTTCSQIFPGSGLLWAPPAPVHTHTYSPDVQGSWGILREVIEAGFPLASYSDTFSLCLLLVTERLLCIQTSHPYSRQKEEWSQRLRVTGCLLGRLCLFIRRWKLSLGSPVHFPVASTW